MLDFLDCTDGTDGTDGIGGGGGAMDTCGLSMNCEWNGMEELDSRRCMDAKIDNADAARDDEGVEEGRRAEDEDEDEEYDEACVFLSKVVEACK